MANEITGIGPARDLTDAIGGPNHRLKSIYVEELVGTSRLKVDAIAAGLLASDEKARLNGLYPSGELTFHCDPDGDWSLKTPGTQEAPFRSLMTALSALRNRYGGITEKLTLRFNPGVYQKEYITLDMRGMGIPILHLQQVDPNNPGIIQGYGTIEFGNGNFNVANAYFRSEGGLKFVNNSNVSAWGNNLTSEVTGNNPKAYLNISSSLFNFSQGKIRLIGNQTSPSWAMVIESYSVGYISPSEFFLEKIPSFNNSFVILNGYSNASFGGSTFTSSPSPAGKRYEAYTFSILDTGGGGANFFPGTGAGQLDGSSTYS